MTVLPFGGFAGGIAALAVLGTFFGSALWIASHVLFAFAAYHDARSKENPDALLWGLLIGFLGLIPGIIYLCVRSSSRKYTQCPKCGFLHYAWEPFCPRCGCQNPSETPPASPYAELYAGKARKELIAGIVVIGISVLLSLGWFLMFFIGEILR